MPSLTSAEHVEPVINDHFQFIFSTEIFTAASVKDQPYRCIFIHPAVHCLLGNLPLLYDTEELDSWGWYWGLFWSEPLLDWISPVSDKSCPHHTY